MFYSFIFAFYSLKLYVSINLITITNLNIMKKLVIDQVSFPFSFRKTMLHFKVKTNLPVVAKVLIKNSNDTSFKTLLPNQGKLFSLPYINLFETGDTQWESMKEYTVLVSSIDAFSEISISIDPISTPSFEESALEAEIEVSFFSDENGHIKLPYHMEYNYGESQLINLVIDSEEIITLHTNEKLIGEKALMSELA